MYHFMVPINELAATLTDNIHNETFAFNIDYFPDKLF